MPLVQRKRRIYVFLHAIRPWLLAALVAGVLWALYQFLSTRGPRKVESAAPVLPTDAAETSRHAQAAAAIDARLREIAAMEVPGDSERAWLESVRDTQREWLRQRREALPADSERLRLIEEHLANVSARQLSQKVAQLEAEATSAPRDARTAERFREALKLQQEINRGGANSRWKDLIRERRLQYETEALAAEQLAADVEAASAEAAIAMKEERWADAEKAFARARESQARINRDFSGTRFVDLARERKLAAEMASLASAAAAEQVTQSENAAEAAALAGRHDEAGRFFAEAKARQEALNATYPASRFASAGRVEEFEVRRQTALSTPLCEKIVVLDAEVTAALRAGNASAGAALVGALAVRNEEVLRKFPRSRRLDAALRKKTSYLASRRSVLAQIHSEVAARLRTLPGSSASLLAGEVPQRIFTLVVGSNPSRHAGEDNPVDSVGWGDAMAFCEQLSWILGRTVRLPDEKEFRVAWRAAAEAAPTVGGGPRDARRATAKDNERFEDLRGNVAEWLQAPPDSPDAPVIGGSYLDTPAASAAADGGEIEVTSELPLQRVAKTERARYIGFRIVVE
jgi:hypothetical protein